MYCTRLILQATLLETDLQLESKTCTAFETTIQCHFVFKMLTIKYTVWNIASIYETTRVNSFELFIEYLFTETCCNNIQKLSARLLLLYGTCYYIMEFTEKDPWLFEEFVSGQFVFINLSILIILAHVKQSLQKTRECQYFHWLQSLWYCCLGSKDKNSLTLHMLQPEKKWRI